MLKDAYIISLGYPKELIDILKNKHDLNVIPFKGINGQKCSEKLINKYLTDTWKFFGPKSAIGCGMSHLHVWKKFVKSRENYAIVFEDDIILLKGTPNLLKYTNKYISKTPKDFDILYLGNFGSHNTPNFFTIVMGLLNMSLDQKCINNYIKKPQVALGLHAYIL